jgi:hypothetical protein
VEVNVIITTWGSDEWNERGRRLQERTACSVHLHDPASTSAGSSRNKAVEVIDPRGFICFLDADDTLGPGYLGAMEAAYEHERQLLTPALAINGQVRCLDDRDIINGLNPCPIGTLIHRDLFEAAGRFHDEPAWEDFALFQRAVLIGAEIKFVPDAVYVAGRNPRGRNSTVRNPKQLRRQIQEDNQRWLRQA